MRPAAELRRLASATGTFDGYVGDGASVPWLEAGIIALGLGIVLRAYKFYLDEHWPFAFKLHDWGYTPYGGLINETREEADHALYEDMLPDNPVDAWIVYRAVRIGGASWFGKSQTGYSGQQVYRAIPNIAQRYTDTTINGDP